MKEFAIDFRGYCYIEAENEEEAKNKFWAAICEEKPLQCHCYDIEYIEETEE